MAGQPRSHTVSNRLYCVAFVILLVAGIGAGALPPSKPTQAIPQLIPAALSAEPNAHTCSRFGQMGGLTPIFSPGEVRVSVRIEARCRAVFRTAQATCTPHRRAMGGAMVPTNLSERPSLSPGKRLHHQRSSSSHEIL